MAITKTVEIVAKTQQAAADINDLFDDLLKKESKAIEATEDLNKSFDKLGKKIDGVDGSAKDLNATVEASATGLNEKLGGAVQGATSSFSAVQDVMALTVGQSENLENAISKVQSAMALAEGVRGIREGAKSFKVLGNSAKTALSGIKSGIAATGIGLLVVALGTIVAYWDDIVKLTGNATDELAEQNTVLGEQITQGNNNLSLLNLELQAVQLRGESDENILASIKKQLLLQKQQQILLIENLQLQLKREKTEAGQVSFWEKIKIGAYQAIGGASGYSKALAESVNPNTEKAIELQTQLDKAKEDSLKVDIQLAQFDKTESDKKKANAQKSVDNAKKLNDEELRLAKEKADALERIRQGEIDTEAERREEELKVVREQYTKLIEEAVKYEQDTTQLKEAQRTKEKELQDKFENEDDEKEKAKTLKKQEEKIKKLEIDKEFENLQFEEKRNILNERDALILQDTLLTEEQKTKILEENADARIKIDELEYQQKINQAKEAGQVLGNLGAIVGKQTAAGKALGIASALINTYVGATEALKQKSVLPSPFDFVAKAVNVAGILATGFKTVKAITSVKVPGGGGGGGGSVPSISPAGSGAAPAAPQFNVVGNTGVNQIAETLGSQQPVQAYVVANNVTTAQSLDRNIISNASLG